MTHLLVLMTHLTLELNKIETRLNETPKLSFSSFSLVALSNYLKKLIKRLKIHSSSLPQISDGLVLCCLPHFPFSPTSAICLSFDCIKIFLLCLILIKSFCHYEKFMETERKYVMLFSKVLVIIFFLFQPLLFYFLKKAC